MTRLPESPEYFIEKLTAFGRALRDALLAARRDGPGNLAGVSRQTSADTIYHLDTHVEPAMEAFCAAWGREMPLVLVAEGVAGDHGQEGVAVFPRGSDPEKAVFRLIVDPIDGTRGIMYDKRSAWVLAGLAPNRGDATRLADIQVAAQVEVPVSKQHVSDVLWAAAGRGAHGEREDLKNGARTALQLRPSQARDLAHGFGSVVSFFPGTKQPAAELMERIVARTLGGIDVRVPMVFDDQYISTGGQFYEVIMGHDRFVADIRPHFYRALGLPMGLAAHPYDVGTALIAREAGVPVTDGLGGSLDGPLDVETPLAFAAFANVELQREIEPIVVEFLREKGLR